MVPIDRYESFSGKYMVKALVLIIYMYRPCFSYY